MFGARVFVMDTVIRRLKIEQLHAQLELALIICVALAREELSRDAKEGILRRWGVVLKESNTLRSALEALGTGV